MSFNWLDYLSLAHYMMSSAEEFPDEEACYRSIVSRAYYAVYCQTRNYVRDTDKKEFYSNDHQALQDHLKTHPHKDRKKIGHQLTRLHQHRKKADYDDELGELPINKAKAALTEATRIQQGLNRLAS
jgi:uncharacterized protein (UPF0332 family)